MSAGIFVGSTLAVASRHRDGAGHTVFAAPSRNRPTPGGPETLS